MAIDAKELRIGNWYNIKNPMDGKLYINQFTIWTEYIEFEGYGEPIPLTPEILIACGLKLHTGTFPTYDIGKLSIHLPSNDYKNGRTYFNQWCIIEGVPEYLHQLQNFHFALTGKELTYNQIIK